MSSLLVFIPGLVSDDRAWSDVAMEFESAGLANGIADVSECASITSMAQSVLDQFDGTLIPVGHSMGGRVAMEIARLAPERLVGMVLVATGAHPLVPGELKNRERVIELANNQRMQALCDQWLPPMLSPATQIKYPEIYLSLERMVLDAGEEQHERQIKALIERPDARPVLKSLQIPTLFVAGALDSWSPPEQHFEMAALMRDGLAKVEIIEEAGHFLQVEQPIKFAKILVDWLKHNRFIEP